MPSDIFRSLWEVFWRRTKPTEFRWKGGIQHQEVLSDNRESLYEFINYEKDHLAADLRVPRWQFYSNRSCLFLKGGGRVPHLEVYGKMVQKSVKMLQIDFQQIPSFSHIFRLHFRDSSLISCHVSNVCMSVVQAGFLLP